jgi:hypothetical protein
MIRKANIDDIDFITKGRFPRLVRVMEEWDFDLINPEYIIKKILDSNLGGDIFTFIQRLPETTPKFKYYMEWHNVAAIPIISYKQWWEKQITQEARNKVRKGTKRGVEIKVVNFDDEFVRGISEIYNETPIRQGKPFPHYGKEFEILKNTHATFLERSTFIGAYYREEMIGFIKLVHAGRFIRTMEIISKVKHRDKAPTNVMIAKAVEICLKNNIPYLVYGQYDYGKIGNPTLMLFKKDLGFQKFNLPRYFIPISSIGKLIIDIGLHNGLYDIFPKYMYDCYFNIRKIWYSNKHFGK